MASIVLLLPELLGCESDGVLAADRYMSGQSLGEKLQNESPPAGAGRACTCTRREEERRQANEEDQSFEDLAASRVVVDVMWP
ncbi:hypothetical protein PR202_ga23997 [Eleusine coracana subsp. coracana]|uniref:Uncharacterized protein n=1 Tax=Eleusine coracana subsp. coracana TaxID=191504 RepID=A0AAV5D792_ELECO|nr:hypothetical protein PR202_ga23997 [Eleusine coracana subsp. coracana]